MLETVAAVAAGLYLGRADGMAADLSPSLFTSTNYGNNRKYAPSLPYTFTKKVLFTIQNDKGVFSDVTKEDEIKGGQRLHNANGRTYQVFYWINEVPFVKDETDSPADFTKIALPTGCLITIRKAYIDTKWVSTFQKLREKGGESWYENAGSDGDRIYKVALVNVTT